MTFDEAKSALSRKLNINYSDISNNELFSDTELGDAINLAARQVWDLRFWDFTEHTWTGTLTAGLITAGYQTLPTDMQPTTTQRLSIDDKRYKKLRFDQYKNLFEANSSSTAKVYAEHQRNLFFNTNVAADGDTIDITGKRRFTRLTTTSALLPFSSVAASENSGDDLIVDLAYAELLDSEKKHDPTKAKQVRTRAFGMLENLWQQVSKGRAAEGDYDNPMLDVPDYFDGDGWTRQGRFKTQLN